MSDPQPPRLIEPIIPFDSLTDDTTAILRRSDVPGNWLTVGEALSPEQHAAMLELAKHVI